MRFTGMVRYAVGITKRHPDDKGNRGKIFADSASFLEGVRLILRRSIHPDEAPIFFGECRQTGWCLPMADFFRILLFPGTRRPGVSADFDASIPAKRLERDKCHVYIECRADRGANAAVRPVAAQWRQHSGRAF